LLLLFLLCGVKTLPPWPLRGRARTKNLLKATQRRAPTGGRDFRNCPALANKTIAEETPIRQYRANHGFGVRRYAVVLADLSHRLSNSAVTLHEPSRQDRAPLYCHTRLEQNPKLDRSLADAIELTSRDAFLIDGSKLDQGVYSSAFLGSVGGILGDWRGPIVVLRARGLRIDPHTHTDITLNDFRHLMDYFALYTE
jgi:hypothetical protein